MKFSVRVIGFQVLTAVAVKFVFWDVGPCSPVKSSQWFATCFLLGLEAICSSKTWVDFYWTTWCYVPEGRTLCGIGVVHSKIVEQN
jgi:hypothetical protein